MEEPRPLTERLNPPLTNSYSPREGEPIDADTERILKWQQDRIQRKLQDDYHSSVQILADLLKANAHNPMQINSVRVLGDTRTRPTFLNWIMKPHFGQVTEGASTVEDVLSVTKHVANALIETDMYASVVPGIERAQDTLASPNEVDLVLYTRPRGRYFLKTASELGNQEGSVSVQARARNFLGVADTFNVAISQGIKTRLAGNISLSAPVAADLKTRGELSFFGFQKDLTATSSCIEGVRGLRASLKRGTTYSTSELAYEATLRHIHALSSNASLSIRNAAGHTVKSALSHTWTYDNRENRAVPTKGHYIRLFHELAGLKGDTAYIKGDYAAKTTHSLFSGLSVSLSGRAGCLYSLDGRAPHFNDKFSLGGPLDVRMIKQNGLGPRDGPDSLGGTMYWAGGISLTSNLPRKPEWPVKTHFFLNAGQLDDYDKTRSVNDNLRTLISQPSATIGVGLLYRFEPVRVEINFGVPLVARKSDDCRRGLQIGLGLDFL